MHASCASVDKSLRNMTTGLCARRGEDARESNWNSYEKWKKKKQTNEDLLSFFVNSSIYISLRFIRWCMTGTARPYCVRWRTLSRRRNELLRKKRNVILSSAAKFCVFLNAKKRSKKNNMRNMSVQRKCSRCEISQIVMSISNVQHVDFMANWGIFQKQKKMVPLHLPAQNTWIPCERANRAHLDFRQTFRSVSNNYKIN